MNVSKEAMNEMGFDRHIAFNENILQIAFGTSETLLCFDTVQFEDYSKVVSDLFDPVAKAKRHQDEFPTDCKKAYEMGIRLVTGG